VDKLSNIDRSIGASFKDALAQPLDLTDCLKIRDGLVNHKVLPETERPKFKVVRLSFPGLNSPWISNN
jgi:hypothetical protein